MFHDQEVIQKNYAPTLSLDHKKPYTSNIIHIAERTTLYKESNKDLDSIKPTQEIC